MKSIALISNTEIINKIFTLIASKLMVNLKIYKTTNIFQVVDLIIVDEFFINDDISKLKLNCNTLVILKSDPKPENNFDFVIEKPFLPSILSATLEGILKNLNTNGYKNDDHKEVSKNNEPSNKELTDDLTQFINNMIDEIDDKNNHQNEDLIVHKEQLGHGGILDENELRRLSNMISETKTNYSKPSKKKIDDDLTELSNIIDRTIDSLSTDNEINFTLNENLLKELSPLFEKIDKNILSQLKKRNEIIVRVRLENGK